MRTFVPLGNARPAQIVTNELALWYRTELNLHEIPVGVPRHRSSATLLQLTFQISGISMRRASRFVDACHVVSPASHSCGSALKGRHVMPFNQPLCESLPETISDPPCFGKVTDRHCEPTVSTSQRVASKGNKRSHRCVSLGKVMSVTKISSLLKRYFFAPSSAIFPPSLLHDISCKKITRIYKKIESRVAGGTESRTTNP